MDKQNENPYAQYEPAFEIIELPSKGIYYPRKDGELISTAKVYHLTAQDENVMASPNIIQSGNMVDVLLRRKVVADIPVDKMIDGDRMAILLLLRATMERIYKVPMVDPSTGEEFIYDIDLGTLKTKDLEIMPNQDGHYDFVLPKCGKRVTFRLMTGEDQAIVKAREKQEQAMRKTDESFYRLFKLEQMVVHVEGIKDRLEMSQFLKNMPIMDARRLRKYMDDVAPSVDLTIEVEAPSGHRFQRRLPESLEFFYPQL